MNNGADLITLDIKKRDEGKDGPFIGDQMFCLN